MKQTLKFAGAVITMGILAKLLLGGNGAPQAAISEAIEKGALVVDTRTAGEYSSGHIEGAIHIPYNEITQYIHKHTSDQSDKIIVYCRSGNRSAHAKRALIESGYTNVINGGGLSRMRKLLAE